jgi:tetratricopeptide (TPR) repeat protein
MQQSLIKILLVFFLSGLMVPGFAANADLDNLFRNLKSAPDEATAKQYVNQIWRAWFQSGDAKVDELMQQAVKERQSSNYDGAIEILNKVIALKPDYPEAWNQRATIYYFKQEYEKSLEDVAKTLELEPRHFGALAGRGMIRFMQNKPALGIQNILQALEIHPFLPERSLIPHELLNDPKTLQKL